MGSEIPRVLDVVLRVSSVDMVLHERVYVYLEDNDLYISFICNPRRSNILEIGQWIIRLSFLCSALL